jgi:uncharacterized paraquat-inducible protein A
VILVFHRGFNQGNYHTTAKIAEIMMERSYRDRKGHGVYCPVCQQVISAVDDACPVCGNRFSGERPSTLKIILFYMAAIAIILFLLSLLIFFMNRLI